MGSVPGALLQKALAISGCVYSLSELPLVLLRRVQCSAAAGCMPGCRDAVYFQGNMCFPPA